MAALERAQRELIEFGDTGMSIMEHSHRGKAYDAVHNEAISLLRELLGFGDDYQVLLLQGGASLQFAMVPMNFIPEGGSADYLLTGSWAEKAYQEAGRIGKVRVAATTEHDKVYTRVPRQDEIKVDPAAAYVHMTSNNTIFGTQFHYIPEVGSVPLVADMSSDFLWKPFDVNRYAFIYAGAQKNIGPSGLVVVIARKSFLEKQKKGLPKILSYSVHVENNSLYNTPNTWGIYMMRNVLAHVKEKGGLPAVEKHNRTKAEKLYAAFAAAPDFYRCPVDQDSRSTMNVVWRLPSEELEKKFLAGATAAGMVGLKGHRSVGGMRASIYNAVPMEAVDRLVAYLGEFRKQN
jgi:phosphoserine aminotransferase